MDPEQRKSVIATAVTMLGLPVITVVLRCLAVLVRKQAFGWDDYLAIADLPFITTIAGLTLGLAFFDQHHGPAAFSHGGMPSYVSHVVIAIQFLYLFGLSLPRFSILCFYYKIFGKRQRWFFITLLTTGGVCLAWLIVNIVVTAVKCIPLEAQFSFDPRAQSSCIDMPAYGLSLLGSSIAIDLALLIIPMPLIFKINASLSKRISVAFMFMCGSLVIIFTAGRLALTVEGGKWATSAGFMKGGPVAAFIQLEAAMSLISVSLPAIFTLFRHCYSQGVQSIKKSRTSKMSNSTTAMSDYHRLKQTNDRSANTQQRSAEVKTPLVKSSPCAQSFASSASTCQFCSDTELEKSLPQVPHYSLINHECFQRDIERGP